ncbi:MAG: transporter [Nibricoccus sp.]
MNRGLRTVGFVGGAVTLMLTSLPARAERELASDRPDATESAFTVERGRVQVESSFAEYARDQHNPEYANVRVTTWTVAPTNVRIGLTANSEVQIVVDSYLDVEIDDRDAGVTERMRGFGDVTLRAKRNFWGNDGGQTALAVMPFLKLPTAKEGLGNDSVEGGLIFPFAAELPGGWGFGAMTEVDVIRNAEDDGYAAAWVNTATVGHDITERLGGFVEFASEVGEGKPVFGFNCGLTYAVDANLQLDLGVNLGLSRTADDLTLFTGFVKRF